MAIHCTTKTFPRQTSHSVLRVCFGKLGLPDDVGWDEISEHKINVVVDRWQGLPNSQRLESERVRGGIVWSICQK